MTTLNRRKFLGTSAAAAGLSAVAAGAFAGDDSAAELKSIGKTPHTRFAVNVEMWWKDLPFLDRLRKTAELGFPAVEFWPWEQKDVDGIAGLTRQLGIVITQFTAWGFTPGMNDPKNHSMFLEAVKAGCKTAKKLDCKMMTVVGGNDQPGMTQAQMHDNIITALRQAAPIAEDNDVTLILEPMNIRVDHKGHCLYGSAPTMAICKAVGSSHVKINWDLYHMQITEGDLTRHMREGFDAGHLGYLQVADNPGRNEPGTGELHYSRVLKEAHDMGYKSYVGLECRPKEDEVTAARRVAAADVW